MAASIFRTAGDAPEPSAAYPQMSIRALFRGREAWIFLAFLVVRVAYTLATRHMELGLERDVDRYEMLSERILAGDHDMETWLFIVAPFYPYLQAAFKFVFGGHWQLPLLVLQLLMGAWSGVVLHRIARRMFDDRVALVSAAIYCVFLPTLAWAYSFAQDMPFQILLIFSIHAMLRAIEDRTWGRTAWAAVLFALTFLTKSHILLFAPFLALHWWLNMKEPPARKAAHLALYVTVCFAFTLPHGLYNLQRHGIYVLSSTGQGGHFLTGHNDDAYAYLVDPPPLGSAEHRRLLNMDYTVIRELRDTVATLPHGEKQRVWMQAGLEWCRENPRKLMVLLAYDLYWFLLPGVNYNLYSFGNWLLMFAASAPVYLFAYPGLWIAWRRSLRKHAWMAGLFASMVIFSCVFYAQNRFRTITLEPYYIIYASFALLRFARWAGLEKRFPALEAPVEA